MSSILSESIEFHQIISKWFNFVVVGEGAKDIDYVE